MCVCLNVSLFICKSAVMNPQATFPMFRGFSGKMPCRLRTALVRDTPEPLPTSPLNQRNAPLPPPYMLKAERKHFLLLDDDFQVFLENSTCLHEARALGGVTPSKIN